MKPILQLLTFLIVVGVTGVLMTAGQELSFSGFTNSTNENSTVSEPIQNTTENNTIPAVEDDDGITGEVVDSNHPTVVENETVTNGTMENATIKPKADPVINKPKLKANSVVPADGIRIIEAVPLGAHNGPERFVIKNNMNSTVNIKGFTIYEVKCNNTIEFTDDMYIQAGKTLTIYSGSGTNTEEKFYLRLRHHFMNLEDKLILIASEYKIGGYK
jgi:hypothetical protein